MEALSTNKIAAKAGFSIGTLSMDRRLWLRARQYDLSQSGSRDDPHGLGAVCGKI
jgi:hypothetical protein